MLWSQTVPHPAPAGVAQAPAGTPAKRARALLRSEGALFAGGAQLAEGRWQGLAPDAIEALRADLQPDVVLVEAHAATGTPLRHDGAAAVWPATVHVAFLVANVAATGRIWGPRVIAGAREPSPVTGEELRRVTREDVLHMFVAGDGLLAGKPPAGLVVPFLTGFGSYRDIDGMFAIVSRLWEHPDVKLVCFAELLGDARRDAADLTILQDLQLATPVLEGERVYAVYPAEQEGDEAEVPQAEPPDRALADSPDPAPGVPVDRAVGDSPGGEGDASSEVPPRAG